MGIAALHPSYGLTAARAYLHSLHSHILRVPLDLSNPIKLMLPVQS